MSTEQQELLDINIEAPESVIIKSKEDLREKLQKAIDDIEANRVYSAEEVYAMLDKI